MLSRLSGSIQLGHVLAHIPRRKCLRISYLSSFLATQKGPEKGT
jgi:hypothetical protein